MFQNKGRQRTNGAPTVPSVLETKPNAKSDAADKSGSGKTATADPAKPEPGKPSEAASAVLQYPPFVVRVFEWSSGEGGSTGRGIVQSKSLGALNASTMPLQKLRTCLAAQTKMYASGLLTSLIA